MTTGYMIASGTDLDAVFAARVSAAIANTNFKSNGGVDLAQRFEPRGGVAPTTVTNFKIADGTDLNMLFKVLSGVPAYSMTAGLSGSYTGYSNGTLYTDIPSDSISPSSVIGTAFAISALLVGPTGPRFVLTHPTVVPANADTSWQTLSITGKFSNNPTVTETRTATRSTSTYTTGSASGAQFADWQTSASFSFVAGNTYQVDIIHT